MMMNAPNVTLIRRRILNLKSKDEKTKLQKSTRRGERDVE